MTSALECHEGPFASTPWLNALQTSTNKDGQLWQGFCSLCGVSLHQWDRWDSQRLGCSWALDKPRTWKNNNTSCHTPRCVEFFVKMFTNLQWSFNWFNIIPSVLIVEPSGCTSGLLGEWLTKSCRWIQMDCRTSLTSNGIAVLVASVLETPSIWLRQIDVLCKPMQTSFSFNQRRYFWQGHGWACWTHFGLPQCMNRVCNNYNQLLLV